MYEAPFADPGAAAATQETEAIKTNAIRRMALLGVRKTLLRTNASLQPRLPVPFFTPAGCAIPH
jgi:hypothetical protein